MRLSFAMLCTASTLMLLLMGSGVAASPREQDLKHALRGLTLTELEYNEVPSLETLSNTTTTTTEQTTNTTTTEPTTTTTTTEPTTTTTTMEPETTSNTTTTEPEPTTTNTTMETEPTTTTTTQPKPTTTTVDPNTTEDPLSGGEIAGIVIGSVAGAALIGGGVYYLYKKEMYCFSK